MAVCNWFRNLGNCTQDVNLVGGSNIQVDNINIPPEDKVEFILQCMIDDVAGDESNLVEYVSLYCKRLDSNNVFTSTLVNNFTDETCTSVYAPVNPTIPCEVGQEMRSEANYRVLNGAITFALPATATSFSVTVATISNPADASTITDGSLIQSDLIEGHSFNLAASDVGAQFFCNPPAFDVKAGDQIIINWSEVC